jgi:hypothetical protein
LDLDDQFDALLVRGYAEQLMYWEGAENKFHQGESAGLVHERCFAGRKLPATLPITSCSCAAVGFLMVRKMPR